MTGSDFFYMMDMAELVDYSDDDFIEYEDEYDDYDDYREGYDVQELDDEYADF